MVFSYAVWIGLGAALGIWRVVRSAPQQQAGAWADLSLIVLTASLLGARLSYVLVNWGYFSAHLIEIPQFWLGGLTWPGAIAGCWLAIISVVVLYRAPREHGSANVSRLTLAWLSDRLYPLLPPVAITTWLAAWQAGVAYGSLTPPGAWWGVPSLDETGVYNLRFPLQLLAALSLLADFWLLEMRVKPMRPPGRLAGRAFFHLLLNLLVVSLLRADPGPQWYGVRVDAWIAIIYLAIYLVVGFFFYLFSLAGKKRSLASSEQSSS